MEIDGKILSTNKRSYPADNVLGYVNVTVVLVAGAVGDYAAYAGGGSPEWVARLGAKLLFEEAKVHFPVGLKEEKYRR